MARKGTKKPKLTVGILTGGGDCPGLNAVIRAVAKTLFIEGKTRIIGIKDGYYGLVRNRTRTLEYEDVSGILTQGGTILGTSNIHNPFRWFVKHKGKLVETDVSAQAVRTYNKLGLDALVCIGGDGTLGIAHQLWQKGLGVVGIPKTIDNDLSGTDVTFGFHSAVTIATEALDRIHSTAQSHHRVMIVEVMGRYAGWLALYSGVASGADIILIPEIPYDIKDVCRRVISRNRRGKRFSIVCVAEGAHPRGGKMVIKKVLKDSPDPYRLGGIGNKLADDISKHTGLATRVTVLGHVQRGGSPIPYDRILATQFGEKAARLVQQGQFGQMASLRHDEIVAVPLEEAVAERRLVPLDHPLVATARSVGTSFGDAD